MHALLFRPDGPGPFPLAVVNHGSEENPNRRALQAMPDFPAITEWFLKRGYAVLLPLRPGHGETGGRYLESQGPCYSADYVKAGEATADSIWSAIDFMTKQPFVKARGVIVVGNSAGGWGALALASRNPSPVAAVVNFSGGRGGHDLDKPNQNCSPDRLIAAATAFGRTARVPTLWLYAANDTFFPPDLSKRLAGGFRESGGEVEYHLLPALTREGHALMQSAGDQTWAPVLANFLTVKAAQ